VPRIIPGSASNPVPGASVRATKVVRVRIDGDTVTVDGTTLPADHAGRTPFEVALAALAPSATRWRPVRAEITESFGVTRCLVLPDASVRDLTFTYTGGEDDALAEPVMSVPLVAPTPAEPTVAASPASMPPGSRASTVLAARRAVLAGLQVRRRWFRPVAAGLAGAVAIAAVAWLLVWGAASLDSPEPDAELTPAAGTASVTASPSGQQTEHGASFDHTRKLRITVTGRIGTVRVTGERAEIRLHLKGPDLLDKHLSLSSSGVEIELAPGTYRWVATAKARVKATGKVTVVAPSPSEAPATATPAAPSSEPRPSQETFAPPVDPDRT